ncbi:MAG: hypothetical protein L0L50_02415 [Propionibacterium sp.]|nr:hypothetical protein [Propionibacterium sp.]
MSKLPYRVKAKRLFSTGWFYYCPGCCRTTTSGYRDDLAISRAAQHAARCPELRTLNFAALACWNCRGTGLVSGDLCLVCLGARITTEPDPTKERHA